LLKTYKIMIYFNLYMHLIIKRRLKLLSLLRLFLLLLKLED
jgi:hypothetical protein